MNGHDNGNGEVLFGLAGPSDHVAQGQQKKETGVEASWKLGLLRDGNYGQCYGIRLRGAFVCIIRRSIFDICFI